MHGQTSRKIMRYEMYCSFLIKYLVYCSQKHKVNTLKKGNVHTNTVPTAITSIKQISTWPNSEEFGLLGFYIKLTTEPTFWKTSSWNVSPCWCSRHYDSLKRRVTINKLLRHNIPEDLNLQQHYCGNFKSHNPNFILQKSVVVLGKYVSNFSKCYADSELIILCLRQYNIQPNHTRETTFLSKPHTHKIISCF